MKKITIKYTGANLPQQASNLASDIKELAKRYKRALKSKDVELVANNPNLDDEGAFPFFRFLKSLSFRAKSMIFSVTLT
ncbi:hypothetical protein DENIS_2960 [Desulfonema ishimotonii]|uniref:Uncharacterized protein n=1 Tax=Desulfonema ishimotonii TaxID=45657 RepID=A0A401FYG0_9BACT|nr:hypothetical protein [Desulfonema ishimotonii]GBC61997.1 hypothetical protein DENIS_2960 [Desulfonema ishimotonii]